MIGLWDTTGNALVKALAAERRSAGGVTSGLALTLIAVVAESQVRQAEAAATIAASTHPCRLLIVVRSDLANPRSRMDAEVVVGGRLGPCEAIVMRTYGRLALHTESVVMPLLAPDVPVVTWWQCAPPEKIAYDPLGIVADRRITDSSQAQDPMAALRVRAGDYAPGDTDLAWTRITPWRNLVTGLLDANPPTVASATVWSGKDDPSGALIRGWLAARLAVDVEAAVGDPVAPGRFADGRPGETISRIRLGFTDGTSADLFRQGGTALLRRDGMPERTVPLLRRSVGEELAEELRRLDADQPYAAALGASTGETGLDQRSPTRVHIWHEPAFVECAAADPAR